MDFFQLSDDDGKHICLSGEDIENMVVAATRHLTTGEANALFASFETEGHRPPDVIIHLAATHLVAPGDFLAARCALWLDQYCAWTEDPKHAKQPYDVAVLLDAVLGQYDAVSLIELEEWFADWQRGLIRRLRKAILKR